MIINCVVCKQDFSSDSIMGRKPVYCPDCRVTGKQALYRRRTKVKKTQIDLVSVQEFTDQFPRDWKYKPAIRNIYLRYGEKVALMVYDEINSC